MLVQTYVKPFLASLDKEDYDFVKGNFTTDYAFHDLDLSGLIPVGTKAVLIAGVAKGNVVDCEVTLARAGYTGLKLKATNYQSVVNQAMGINVVVPVSGDRKIKYLISDVVWEFLAFSVVGWWV